MQIHAKKNTRIMTKHYYCLPTLYLLSSFAQTPYFLSENFRQVNFLLQLPDSYFLGMKQQ